MRNSSVLVGLLFGLVLTALLAVPLGVELPGKLVPRWPQVAPGAPLFAWLFAVLSPIAGGFLAGRINQDEAIRAGSGAGSVSSLVALTLIVVPAAGVWSASGLYLAASSGRLTPEAIEELLSAAMLTASWAPATFGAVVLIGGLALGALGGFLAEMTGGSRRARQVDRSSVPMAGLTAVVVATTTQSVLSAHAELTLLPALHHPVSWTSRILLTAPLAATAIANVLLLSWTIRDAALLWRSGRRIGGIGWASLACSLVVGGHVATAVLHPYAWLSPWPWLALGAEGAAILFTLFRHWMSDLTLAEAPRNWFELAIEGLEMGIVSVSLFVLAGGGTASVWAVQLLPVAWAVASGSGEIPLDARDVIQRQFAVHLVAPVAALLLAGTYAVLATPVWLIGIAVVRRAEARAS